MISGEPLPVAKQVGDQVVGYGKPERNPANQGHCGRTGFGAGTDYSNGRTGARLKIADSGRGR